MERIKPGGENRFRQFKKTKGQEKSAESQELHRVSSFSQVVEEHALEGLQPRDIDAPIEELLDSLHSRGEQLKENPTMESIKEYKKAVSDFLQYIVKNAFQAERIEGSRFHPLKKQYGYTLIQVINKKLDSLATGILQSQYSQLDILRRVDEINGMIVDLLK